MIDFFKAIYGFYLAPEAVGGAELTLGGVDMSKMRGDVIYAPLANQKSAHWILNVEGIFVNNKSSSILQSNPLTATIDTGTSNILLPTNYTQVTRASMESIVIKAHPIFRLFTR